MFDLLFQSAIVVDGSGDRPFTADVGIRDGLIAKLAERNKSAKN